jgi:hypothetical protein
MLMTNDDDDDLTRADRAALELALKLVRKESPGRDKQIDAKLADEPWCDVAEFAAGVCQSRALRLNPWEKPPAWLYDNEMNSEGGKFLQRMLDAGVSRYHPDPMAALEAAERRGAT